MNFPGDEFKEFEGQELEHICFTTCDESKHRHLTFRFGNGRMLHLQAAMYEDRPVMESSEGSFKKNEIE